MTSSPLSVDAIVLAAGRASRLRVAKVLLPAGPRETLLSRALALALQAVGGSVVCVLGYEAEMAEAEIHRWTTKARVSRQRLVTVRNPEFASGMSSSLRRGAERVQPGSAALVLLADQPALDADRVCDLVERYCHRKDRVRAVGAASRGEQRTPVVLGPELLSLVPTLTGDQGARRLLRERAADVELVEWGAGEWEADVDTWQDYAALARSRGWDRESRATMAKRCAEYLESSDDVPLELCVLRSMALDALHRGIELGLRREG